MTRITNNSEQPAEVTAADIVEYARRRADEQNAEFKRLSAMGRDGQAFLALGRKTAFEDIVNTFQNKPSRPAP